MAGACIVRALVWIQTGSALASSTWVERLEGNLCKFFNVFYHLFASLYSQSYLRLVSWTVFSFLLLAAGEHALIRKK